MKKIVKKRWSFNIAPLDGKNTIGKNMQDFFVLEGMSPAFYTLANILSSTPTPSGTIQMCEIYGENITFQGIFNFLRIYDVSEHALTQHQLEVFIRSNIDLLKKPGTVRAIFRFRNEFRIASIFWGTNNKFNIVDKPFEGDIEDNAFCSVSRKRPCRFIFLKN